MDELQIVLAFHQKMVDLIHEIAFSITEDETGIDPLDDEALKDFGENSWFAKEEAVETSLAKQSIKDVNKKAKLHLSKKELADWQAISKEAMLALSMTEIQFSNARCSDVIDAIAELPHD